MSGKTKIAILATLAVVGSVTFTFSGTNGRVRNPNPAIADLTAPDHVRPIIARACRDCHSDQTQWPWYTRLPMVSLLIEHDVKKGREHLNFSTWAAKRGPTRNQLQEVCDAVSDNTMPPRSYRLMHPESKLSPGEVDALCDWADGATSLSQSQPGTP